MLGAGRRLRVDDGDEPGPGGWSSASSSASLGTTSPQSRVTSTTSAPWRAAICAIRWPKKPAYPTMTTSPGETRFTIPVSIPDMPVACSGSVTPA